MTLIIIKLTNVLFIPVRLAPISKKKIIIKIDDDTIF
jgi:hypothetical protein